MEQDKKKLSVEKKIYIVIGVLVLVFCIGMSYALWSVTREQEGENLVEAGCLDVDVTFGAEMFHDGMIPLSDIEGEATTPYTFTIENTCDIYAKYQVNIEILNTTTLDESNIKSKLDDKATGILSEYSEVTKTLSTATKSYNIYEGGLSEGETITHNLRNWIKDTADHEAIEGQQLKTKVVIVAVPSEEPLPTLYDTILANNIVLTTIPDFSQISTNSDTGLYKGADTLADEYGDTYYFRGTRELLNNNVIFGGFQWKVIRINGDGSIRLIYNGTENQFNTNSTVNIIGEDTQIGYKEFNSERIYNAYVGYMYGTPNSSTYAEEHANINDSTIKSVLDTWYEDNFLGTRFESLIVDNIFCGDRSFSSSNTGGGIGTSSTKYITHERLHTNRVPTLKCQNTTGEVSTTHDQYTVNAKDGKGNGALTYPVGLIAADEASLAGSKTYDENSTYYLYTEEPFWSMSPNSGGAGASYNWYVSWHSYLSFDGGGVYTGNAVRPVINISSNATISSGNGSSTNPYIVE